MITIKAEELRVGDRFTYRETPYATVWEVTRTFPEARRLGYAGVCTGYQKGESFDYLDSAGGLVLVSRAAPAVETITPPAVTGVKHDDNKPWAGTVLAGFWCDAYEDALAKEVENNLSEGAIDAVLIVTQALLDASVPIAERLINAREAMCNLMLRGAIPAATRVGTYGARKYERDNWLHVEDGINRYYEAAGRHVLQILCGDWIDKPDDVNDPGSGLANLDHICWCIFAGARLADRAAT